MYSLSGRGTVDAEAPGSNMHVCIDSTVTKKNDQAGSGAYQVLLSHLQSLFLACIASTNKPIQVGMIWPAYHEACVNDTW